MVYNTARNTFTSDPAQQTDAASQRNVRRFSGWLEMKPRPYVHPEVVIEGIQTYEEGADSLMRTGGFEINKHLWAYHRVFGPDPEKQGYYDILAECEDDKGIFHPERCDRNRMFFTAESYRVASSSLVSGLNRLCEKIHAEYVERNSEGEIPPRWRTVPVIDIGAGEYRLTHSMRHKMIRVLYDRETFLAEDEDGNKKTTRRKTDRNTLAPSALQRIYNNAHKFLEKPIKPMDIHAHNLWYQWLERFQRGGRELRLYEKGHFVFIRDGIGGFWRIHYPKGTKNNKYKNKDNRNIKHYDIDTQHPLSKGLKYYFKTRGDHVKNSAFWMQCWPRFRVQYTLISVYVNYLYMSIICICQFFAIHMY